MDSKFKLTFLFLLLTELLSFFIFLAGGLNNIAFVLILLLITILSIIKLDYGVYIALVELFIGSKGYLFAFSLSGHQISIRIGIWVVVLSVWATKMIIRFARNRGQKQEKLSYYLKKQSTLIYFIILFMFIAWGIISGYLNRNSLSNIFFDANGWFYFAYLFPLYFIFKNKSSEQLKIIWQIFLGSAVWLSLKTLTLLFIFSHSSENIIRIIYRWVRETGVGEITLIQGGFYRVFFQSHIFVLAAFFITFLFSLTFFGAKAPSKKVRDLLLLILFLAVNIVSFSRSNWVGAVFGLIVLFLYILKKYNWKKAFAGAALFVFVLLSSLGLIFAIVKFPFPSPIGGFNTASLLSKRATQVGGEPALSSRWSLYPRLWEKIKSAPVLGQGFGTTVTYISSDPRVLETHPGGEYTTFAFEWGWLDIWLKLGIFGLIIYIALIIKIIITSLAHTGENSLIINGLGIGLCALAVLSFFSPYLNHPLGIGYISLAALAAAKY